jgi:hypothetical protein
MYFLLGAQKAGTTWLSEMLLESSGISSVKFKEPHYYNKKSNFILGDSYYKKIFTKKNSKSIDMDFTPNYLWCNATEHESVQSCLNDDIPALIKNDHPDSKFIVLLRNPVDRAVSAFYHHIRAGRISPNSNILDVMGEYGIFSMGLYDEQLKYWFNYFDRKSFLVLFYESDLDDSCKCSTLSKACNFLDVEYPNSVDLYKKFNTRNSYLEMRLNFLPKYIRKLSSKLLPNCICNNDLFKISVSNKDRETLLELYSESVENLRELVDSDVPW